MRKSRFTESQIVGILKEGEAGVPLADLVRKHGISRGSYFNWRSKYAGTSVSETQAYEGTRIRESKAEADVRRTRPRAFLRSGRGCATR